MSLEEEIKKVERELEELRRRAEEQKAEEQKREEARQKINLSWP